MSAATCDPVTWQFGPADQLLSAVAATRALLERDPNEGSGAEGAEPGAGGSSRSVVIRLADLFHLSPFEVNTVLTCTAMELHGDAPALCAQAQGDERLRYPTFQLLLNLFPEAHWAALLPGAPLRHWRLLRVDSSENLLTARLSLEESTLHFLMGSPAIEEKYESLFEHVALPPILPASYRPATERLANLFLSCRDTRVAHLQGSATQGKRMLASAACAAIGLQVRAVRAAKLAAMLPDWGSLLRIAERDAALCALALIVDLDGAGPVECAAAAEFADSFQGVVLLVGGTRIELRRRALVNISVERPAPDEQRALWSFALGDQAAGLKEEIERISTQFSLDCDAIFSASRELRERLPNSSDSSALMAEVCRLNFRPALDSLAQRIAPRATWQDIVLPESCMDLLRAIVAQVRHQGKVLETWGFAERASLGLGISALFHGQSGTGKTMAAEILASELALDLYRIDLSQVLSKYVGETEKNLGALFDAAENTGCVLLFDEADALFGKRGEVIESHDRYANIEVSYLLQRIEAYKGLAILTTNLRGMVDAAFLRRIRFFVPFSFPDISQRRRIWERMFPPAMPSEGLSFDKLARLNLPGGNIRNIALSAAYIAADRNEPLRMGHLLVAARRECAKLERPLSDFEIGGWV